VSVEVALVRGVIVDKHEITSTTAKLGVS